MSAPHGPHGGHPAPLHLVRPASIRPERIRPMARRAPSARPGMFETSRAALRGVLVALLCAYIGVCVVVMTAGLLHVTP